MIFRFHVKLQGCRHLALSDPGAETNFNSAWTLEMQKLMVKVPSPGIRGPGSALLKGLGTAELPGSYNEGTRKSGFSR